MRYLKKTFLILIFTFGLGQSSVFAQDNYEIQVYGSELIPTGYTMFELHSNYTAIGSTMISDGVRPTQGAFHETVEITHGFAPWLEVGVYAFNSINPGYGYNWVGTHIRPRVTAPEEWKLPLGLSLAAEFGYQRPEYATNVYTLEIRPIVDKKINKWYFAINPVFDYAFDGLDKGKPFSFAPDFKISYDISKKVTIGIEYYSSLGFINSLSPFPEQQHQIVPSIDLDLFPDWEFNFGAGIGITKSTDAFIVKMILGRKVGKKSGIESMIYPTRHFL